MISKLIDHGIEPSVPSPSVVESRISKFIDDNLISEFNNENPPVNKFKRDEILPEILTMYTNYSLKRHMIDKAIISILQISLKKYIAYEKGLVSNFLILTELKDVATSPSTRPKSGPKVAMGCLKGLNRLIVKIMTEYDYNLYRNCDLIRYTIEEKLLNYEEVILKFNMDTMFYDIKNNILFKMGKVKKHPSFTITHWICAFDERIKTVLDYYNERSSFNDPIKDEEVRICLINQNSFEIKRFKVVQKKILKSNLKDSYRFEIQFSSLNDKISAEAELEHFLYEYERLTVVSNHQQYMLIRNVLREMWNKLHLMENGAIKNKRICDQLQSLINCDDYHSYNNKLLEFKGLIINF
jgi:hypothetical protein